MTEYKNYENYNRDFKYWCNGIGELFNPNINGLPSIEADELPRELQRAYSDLWYGGSVNSLCYLVSYKENYCIALLCEYDQYTAENIGTSFDKLYAFVSRKAIAISENELVKTAKAEVISTKELGFNNCNEIIVVVPWNVDRDLFNKLTNYIDKTAYELHTFYCLSVVTHEDEFNKMEYSAVISYSADGNDNDFHDDEQETTSNVWCVDSIDSVIKELICAKRDYEKVKVDYRLNNEDIAIISSHIK